MERKEKCVVILSGGSDSSTVAYWAKDQGYDVQAITFKYGQIATKEIEYAIRIADLLDIPVRSIDLSSLRGIYVGVTSLCDETIQMTPAFSPPIIVPFRNAIFLSVGVAYAVSLGASRIFYGAQGSDEPFYPDCTQAFYKSFETAARLGTGKELVIEAPFSSVPKSAIIREGLRLGVPFHLTWSCYYNAERHCGVCESCVNRKNAFREAGVLDPTEYM